MNRFATRYWLQNKPLSVQLWVCLSLAEGVTLAIALACVFLLFPPAAPAEPRRWYALAALFPLMAIANLFVAKLVARRITEPLERLSGDLERIRGKNWSEPVLQVTRRDEIGTLINALSQIQRNVVELNEDEEFFYQSVSHGLKTPIMVIQNCCAAYQDGIYGPEAIDIIMKEIAAVEGGIKKLLYVSSFDHMLGRQSDFRPVELRGLLEACRRRFTGNERNIRLELAVPEGRVVPGNEAALQTVFDNLVENGLRYAKSYIRMELTGEEPGGYLLTVENDGDPIPQATLNVLFEKFYKGTDGSFGLGLYIAKKIVQFHRGDIWAVNWTGGVRFQLLLRKEERPSGRRQKGMTGS